MTTDMLQSAPAPYQIDRKKREESILLEVSYTRGLGLAASPYETENQDRRSGKRLDRINDTKHSMSKTDAS